MVRPAAEVGPAAVVRVAVAVGLLQRVQAGQQTVRVLVSVVVVVVVLAADAADTSGFLVLHGSGPVRFDKFRH